MEFTEILNLIISILTLFGIVFGVYLYFKKPQIESKEFDLLMQQEFKSHETAQDKEFAAFDTKLLSLKENINNLRDNHIHTLQEKIEYNSKNISEVKESIVRIETILAERLPKKQ